MGMETAETTRGRGGGPVPRQYLAWRKSETRQISPLTDAAVPIRRSTVPSRIVGDGLNNNLETKKKRMYCTAQFTAISDRSYSHMCEGVGGMARLP